MNSFEIKYEGSLRTSAKHLASGEIINTDAPKDNHGLGECFSPTDLVCTSLASCMLTIMAIAVEKNGVNIDGTKASVKKTMRSEPRMIAQIDITITFPASYDDKTQKILERAALNCPVHKSLSDEVVKNIEFIYTDSKKKEDKESEENKLKLDTKERGRRFFKKLSEQGPTLDRVGETFVRGIKKKP